MPGSISLNGGPRDGPLFLGPGGERSTVARTRAYPEARTVGADRTQDISVPGPRYTVLSARRPWLNYLHSPTCSMAVCGPPPRLRKLLHVAGPRSRWVAP